jgi:hypothetical protein
MNHCLIQLRHLHLDDCGTDTMSVAGALAVCNDSGTVLTVLWDVDLPQLLSEMAYCERIDPLSHDAPIAVQRGARDGQRAITWQMEEAGARRQHSFLEESYLAEIERASAEIRAWRELQPTGDLVSTLSS